MLFLNYFKPESKEGNTNMSLFESTEWIYASNELPKIEELIATIANGFVGTRIFSDTVYAAGVFNGDHLNSHRARIPSTLPVNISFKDGIILEENMTRFYALNAADGYFFQSLTSDDGDVFIQQKVIAHREFKNLLITKTSAKTTRKGGFRMTLMNNFGTESKDIDLKHESIGDINILTGQTKETESIGVPKSGVAVAYYPKNEIELLIPGSGEWNNHYAITSVCTSLETENPREKAVQEYTLAKQMIDKDSEKFWQSHVDAWHEIWQNGTIRVTGNLSLAQAVNSCLYYIISSFTPSWPHGLSPGGLPSNGYLGHTFWDQETWMYPTILLFHQEMARSCLQYRYERMEAATKRAKDEGYQGLMFPWESACSGIEVCPEPYPYSTFEHHIIGDIGFAVQQYWMATLDSKWFESQGMPLLKGVAEFWASRVKFDEVKKAYCIYHVQGPDEYHYDINNSVYTNVIAKINLTFAVYIFEKFKIKVPEAWGRIASLMYVPFDERNQYHPEFDGYQKTTTVKQADTILIGFPLMYDMSVNVRENDLKIYEAVTDKNGPAMTKAMFAVGWLELKKFALASESFKEGYANITEPFKVWTETPDGGEVNFITGAGGFLQSVVFGYGGIRLKLDGMHLDPVLPDGTKQLALQGMTYLGNKINYDIDSENMSIMVTKQLEGKKKLVFVSDGQTSELKVGVPCRIKHGKAVIKQLEDTE